MVILVTYVGPGKDGGEYKLDQIAEENKGVKAIFRLPKSGE